MGLRNAVLAACGILGLACGAQAQETVKLEYKLPAGTELIYKSSGTYKLTLAGQGDVAATGSGTERFVIAEADPAGTGLIVGQSPDIKVAAKMTQSNGSVDNKDESFHDASVCRLDRAGNVVLRTLKGAEKLPEYSQMILFQISHRDFDVSNLPAGAVAVGATWEGSGGTSVPVIPIPTPCKIVSTLAEIKTVDGHKCALIKSKLSPSDKKLAGMPAVEIAGDVETLFDVDGGFSRSVTGKLTMKMDEHGMNATGTIETSAILDSVKMLPPEEAARETAVIKAFDAAVARLYDGEYDKAAEPLEALKPADVPAAWKSGVNKAIGQVKQFAQMAKGGAPGAMQPPAADPAQKLFAEAQKAAQDEKWADAVAKYKELAEKNPGHDLAPTALLQAARIAETKLNDKKSADELRQSAVALQEKRAAGDPMELYRLAGTYVAAGDTEKAIAAYRKVVAAESKTLSANMRLLAQFRLGGLLEKQGKTAEAVEAYKAMDAMAGDDSYSTKLKEQAKKKIEALSAANR